jgi:hypothetical protein
MNTSLQEGGETVSNRQVGYGLVFGVPKSVSIYLAITADQVAENIARSAANFYPLLVGRFCQTRMVAALP